MKPFTRLDRIIDDAENEYLDEGGGLSAQRRDHYFVQVIKYARQLEKQLDDMGKLKYIQL